MEIAAQHPLAELGAVEIRPLTGIAFPAGTRTSEDEALLRDLIEDLSQSIRAKDAERAFAVYGPGTLSYAFPPPLASEPEKEGLQSWFDTWEGPIGYELHRLALNVGGDVAFSTAFLHLTGTKTDGERSELWGRVTMGFRKLEGGWKIVHEHESVPFLMDGSGKAALDLKP
ncbi:DUF4440 domain-containing protein [bacterium]|nr:MAG: DUF4440 domain-containing protein [bacterium]